MPPMSTFTGVVILTLCEVKLFVNDSAVFCVVVREVVDGSNGIQYKFLIICQIFNVWKKDKHFHFQTSISEQSKDS